MLEKLKAIFGGSKKASTDAGEKYCEQCQMNVPADHSHDQSNSQPAEDNHDSEAVSSEEQLDDNQDSSEEQKYCEQCQMNVPVDHSH